MNCDHAEWHFTTREVINRKDGYCGIELLRESRIKQNDPICVARILFWDACGQFFFETFNTDIPVKIVEDLFAEAKATIKIR